MHGISFVVQGSDKFTALGASFNIDVQCFPLLEMSTFEYRKGIRRVNCRLE